MILARDHPRRSGCEFATLKAISVTTDSIARCGEDVGVAESKQITSTFANSTEQLDPIFSQKVAERCVSYTRSDVGPIRRVVHGEDSLQGVYDWM